MAAAWVVGLCWARVCEWFAARVWWVRERWERVDCREERFWVRKVESVESESEMRERAAVSFAILKCEVHWAIN